MTEIELLEDQDFDSTDAGTVARVLAAARQYMADHPDITTITDAVAALRAEVRRKASSIGHASEATLRRFLNGDEMTGEELEQVRAAVADPEALLAEVRSRCSEDSDTHDVAMKLLDVSLPFLRRVELRLELIETERSAAERERKERTQFVDQLLSNQTFAQLRGVSFTQRTQFQEQYTSSARLVAGEPKKKRGIFAFTRQDEAS